MVRQWSKQVLGLLLVITLLVSSAQIVSAASSSNNYKVTNTQFGPTSTNAICSEQYCSSASIGALGGDDSSSTNYQAKFQQVTDDSPRLAVIVEPGESSLGQLSTTAPASTTTIVKVLSYLSSGYTLKIKGDPPTYNGHALSTPSSPTASAPGTEQFGINLVKNTEPAVGGALEQVPSSETSFGQVSANYGSENLFMYQDGDIIASSPKSTGQTNYTISMIINISDETPAGHYVGEYSAVVVPQY